MPKQNNKSKYYIQENILPIVSTCIALTVASSLAFVSQEWFDLQLGLSHSVAMGLACTGFVPALGFVILDCYWDHIEKNVSHKRINLNLSVPKASNTQSNVHTQKHGLKNKKKHRDQLPVKRTVNAAHKKKARKILDPKLVTNNMYQVFNESGNKKVAAQPVSPARSFSSPAPKPQPSTQKVILTEEKVEQPKQRDFKHNNPAQGQSQAKVNHRLRDKPSIPQGKTKNPEDKKVTSKEISVSPQKISTPQPLGSRPTPRVWGHIAKKDGIYSAKGLYTGPSTSTATQANNNTNTFNALNKAL